jgi:hypothetical protein
LTATEILARLSCRRPGCECTRAARRGKGRTHCPVHPDRNPSLAVEERDGEVLWHCHGGCRQEDVTAALRERGLIGDQDQKRQPAWQIRQYRYEIRNTERTLIAVHVREERVRPDRSKPAKRFWWEVDGSVGLRGQRTSDLPLYGSELLAQYPDLTPIVVEGEKAADSLRQLWPLVLATVTGASGTPSREVLSCLQGRKRVVLWPDNDQQGKAHTDRIAAILHEFSSVVVVEWPEAPDHGDAADWVERGGTREELMRLVRQARPWQAMATPAATELPPVWIRVRGREPSEWSISIDHREEMVRLTTEQLLSWRKVCAAFVDQRHRMPTWRPRSQEQWEATLERLLERADEEEVPQEFTAAGSLAAVILDWCRQHQSPVQERAVEGGVWLDRANGRWVFRSSTLLTHLRQLDGNLRVRFVWEVLRDLGAEPRVRVRVGGTQLRLVAIPVEAAAGGADEDAEEGGETL